ncbi:hypothetical protein FOL47_008737 [Perkinsus chesapeaki]|uniref:RING-type domain-containing protein n=1 Tax=Perkinsus chesapeaki TaxID=330153 RepID=A0A7J6LCV8_PERCH|nr:hypothetical protein FOL47_008737 [Perkinsus chesapeaki]
MASRPPTLSYFCHSCGHRGTTTVCRVCGGKDSTTVTDIPPILEEPYAATAEPYNNNDEDDDDDAFDESWLGRRHLTVESVTVMPAPSTRCQTAQPGSHGGRQGRGSGSRFVVAPNITEEDDMEDPSAGPPPSTTGGGQTGKAVCAAMMESLEKDRVDISPIDIDVLREDLGLDGRRYCAICADEDEDPDPFTELPCGHEFHLDCLKLWLTNNSCCPLCRFQLPKTDIEYYRMVGDDLMVRLLEQQQHHYEMREESKRRQHARKVHLALLRGNPLHVGVRCAWCEMTPIIGSTRYRCDVCGPDFTVCQECESRYFCAQTHRHKCSTITVDSKQLLKDWPIDRDPQTSAANIDGSMRERLEESRGTAIEGYLGFNLESDTGRESAAVCYRPTTR